MSTDSKSSAGHRSSETEVLIEDGIEVTEATFNCHSEKEDEEGEEEEENSADELDFVILNDCVKEGKCVNAVVMKKHDISTETSMSNRSPETSYLCDFPSNRLDDLHETSQPTSDSSPCYQTEQVVFKNHHHINQTPHSPSGVDSEPSTSRRVCQKSLACTEKIQISVEVDGKFYTLHEGNESVPNMKQKEFKDLWESLNGMFVSEPMELELLDCATRIGTMMQVLAERNRNRKCGEDAISLVDQVKSHTDRKPKTALRGCRPIYPSECGVYDDLWEITFEQFRDLFMAEKLLVHFFRPPKNLIQICKAELRLILRSA